MNHSTSDQTKTSQRLDALMATSAEIMGEAPHGDQLAFLHAVLCQVGLPRRAVKGQNFMRRSGAAWINVQAGYIDEGRGPVPQPVPYGAFPRLALAYITTQAVRHRTPEIMLGSSVADFLRRLGMERGGRRYDTLRRQMHALAACRLQMGCMGRTFNGQPVSTFDAWLKDGQRDMRQGALWPGKLVLTQDYYSSLLENAVPLDLRAMLELGGSALALDMYFWLAHRLHRVEKPVMVPWSGLQQQFGQEYEGAHRDKNFRRHALHALRDALAVYPKAKVEQVTGGLRLLPSPPPVLPRE